MQGFHRANGACDRCEATNHAACVNILAQAYQLFLHERQRTTPLQTRVLLTLYIPDVIPPSITSCLPILRKNGQPVDSVPGGRTANMAFTETPSRLIRNRIAVINDGCCFPALTDRGLFISVLSLSTWRHLKTERDFDQKRVLLPPQGPAQKPAFVCSYVFSLKACATPPFRGLFRSSLMASQWAALFFAR